MKVLLSWSLLAPSWVLVSALSNMTITSTHTRSQHLRGINAVSAAMPRDSSNLTWSDLDWKQDHRSLQGMHSNHNDFVPLINEPAQGGYDPWSDQGYRPEVATLIPVWSLCDNGF
jgi:hypothetical protein